MEDPHRPHSSDHLLRRALAVRKVIQSYLVSQCFVSWKLSKNTLKRKAFHFFCFLTWEKSKLHIEWVENQGCKFILVWLMYSLCLCSSYVYLTMPFKNILCRNTYNLIMVMFACSIYKYSLRANGHLLNYTYTSLV